jgi:hypothetical protein
VTTNVRLKGTNFHGAFKSVERRFGKEALQRVFQLVPERARGVFVTGEILTGGWYDVEHYDALLRAIEQAFPGEKLLLRQLAHDAITEDFSTIFKIVRLIVSPQSALSNTTKVLARYIEGGKVTVVSATDSALHLRFEEYYGFTRPLWDDMLGGMEAVLDMMKVKRLSHRVLSGGDGPSFEIVLRYVR